MTASSKTLANFITALLDDLSDPDAETFTDTDQLDRAIRRALYKYSEVKPQETIGTITLEDDGREISLSTLTGLVDVQRVWVDYDADDPGYPPAWAKFQLWDDKATLFIHEDDEPQSGDVIRVYYTKQHAIKDLDSATATTIPIEDEETVLLGAAAHAALQQARRTIGQVNPSDTTPAQWSRWGNRRLSEFRQALSELSRDISFDRDARVKVDWDI